MKRWDVVAAMLCDPRRGAELGVWDGAFSATLLAQFPSLTMYAVDVVIRPKFAALGRKYPDRLITLNMRTTEAARAVPDGSLDFVFIDADHSYDAVAADIAAWRGKVRSGGILCGHDYGHVRFPGVKRAVDEVGLPVVVGDDATWMIQL